VSDHVSHPYETRGRIIFLYKLHTLLRKFTISNRTLSEQDLHLFVTPIHRSWQNKVASARSHYKIRYYGNLETYKHCITIFLTFKKNAPNHLRLRLRQTEAENFTFNLQRPHGYCKCHQFVTLNILHPAHTVSEQTAITPIYGTD
jgi:hypothetical protein